jgi:hypothetical protein
MRRGVERGGHRTGSECALLPFLSVLSVLSVLLLTLLTAGCDAEVPGEPGVSDSLMVEVLIGVHLADARAAQTGEPRDSLRAAALDALGTDTAAFGRALDYYAHHPDRYQPLYERALDRLLDERRRVVD